MDDSEDSRSEEGDQSGSEDEMNELRLFRQDLLDRIEETKAAGSFATGGALKTSPNPGIRVDGEIIALPLLEEEARKLASRSLKAPFGKNKETLIDESVRKTLEIGADRIDFQNPGWLDFVDDLVGRVAHELGVPSTAGESHIRAELYKSLLYEPGAMFKAHRDTEKCPGMFGTLVICLPSKHTGGIVCLEHGKDSIELSTAEHSGFDYSYLAWYADVTHEINPILTGYRWVLTYNLIQDSNSSCPSASVLDSQTQSLVQALSRWENLEYPPTFLVYPLSHLYTSRSLSLSCLKGHDYQRARCLANSCARHGKFHLFLAQFDRYESWPNDESSGDRSMLDRRTYLHHVCDLEGFRLSPVDVDISRSYFLQPIIYADRVPDTRTGGEYVGNQHVEFEDTYSDTVVLIIPENFMHAPLCGIQNNSDGVEATLKHLRTSICDKTNALLPKILEHICRIVLEEGFAADEQNDKYLGHVAVTAAYLGDKSLFGKASQQIHRFWKDERWSELGGLIDIEVPAVDIKDIASAAWKCCRLRGVYLALTHFYHGFRTHNPHAEEQAKLDHAKQWYSDELIKLIDASNRSLGEEDVGTIMNIVLGHKIEHTPVQRDEIDETVVDFVEEFIHKDRKLVNALAVEILLELSHPEVTRSMFLHRLFRIILETAISSFDLDLWYRYLNNTRCRDNSTLRGEKTPRPSNGGLIRAFFDWAAAYSEDAASRILWKISIQASEVKKDVVSGILVPLMKELLLSADTGSLEVQYCFQLLMKTYITKTVGKEPPKPVNWARRAEVRKCTWEGCDKCAPVNAFLENSEAKEQTIDVGQDKDHVRWNFDFYAFLEAKEVKTENEAGKIHFTKTLKGWEKHHRNWEWDAKQAQQKLQDLPKDKLEQALGTQYGTLMALDIVRVDGGTAEQGDVGLLSDKTESQALLKRPRDEDPDESDCAAPKRARHDDGGTAGQSRSQRLELKEDGEKIEGREYT